MKIKIERVDEHYNLIATNEDGRQVAMDASPEIGGKNNGMRPMQLLISALGGCSSIDIISILNKQRQNLKDIKIEIDALRESKKPPAIFSKIQIRFFLYGDITYEKAKHAIELSMDKYCSVARILEKSAEITYDFKIIPHND